MEIYFGNRPDGLALNAPIGVFVGVNPGGTSALSFPSSPVTYSNTIGAQNTFVTYTVPSVTITSGDFVVGFASANPVNAYPADLDQASTSQGRSYASADGVNYSMIDSFGLPGNLGIRAVVTVGQ